MSITNYYLAEREKREILSLFRASNGSKRFAYIFLDPAPFSQNAVIIVGVPFEMAINHLLGKWFSLKMVLGGRVSKLSNFTNKL